MKMTQDQRGTDRAKRMAELEDLVPNTLRCVEVLKRHAPTLKYVARCQDHAISKYRMDLPVVKDLITMIAFDEGVCFDQLWSVCKADFLPE